MAALTLRAGLLSEGGRTAPTIEPLARKVSRDLRQLARTVRGEPPPPVQLQSAEAYLMVDPDIDAMISEELRMIIDGVETIPLLLRHDCEPR